MKGLGETLLSSEIDFFFNLCLFFRMAFTISFSRFHWIEAMRRGGIGLELRGIRRPALCSLLLRRQVTMDH